MASKQCTLLILFVALLAVFAFADEAPVTSDAAPVTSSTAAEDSPVEASAYCSLYTSCSTCSVPPLSILMMKVGFSSRLED